MRIRTEHERNSRCTRVRQRKWSPRTTRGSAGFPIYNASQNRTPVVVRKRGGGKPNLVLTLRRSADIYWGGARSLLIIDHPVANTSDLLLFRLEPTGDVRRLRTTPTSISISTTECSAR